MGMQYKVGDRVLIKEKKCGVNWNSTGKMDKWMGKVMTIRRIDGCGYRMEEDKEDRMDYDKYKEGWKWFAEMIERKVEEQMEAKYKVGDKVRIVSEKTGTGWASRGGMDKWLGKVMTVREVCNSGYRMVEDKAEHYGGWYWHPHMFEGKAYPEGRIVIEYENGITKVRHYPCHMFDKAAKAKCNPDDTFDLKAGVDLAIERVLAPEPEKFSMDKFLEGKQKIKVSNKADALLLQVYLMGKGIKWCDGDSMTDVGWYLAAQPIYYNINAKGDLSLDFSTGNVFDFKKEMLV